MNLLCKGGRIVDPSRGVDAVGDLLIEHGKIVRVGKESSLTGGSGDGDGAAGLSVLDLRGMIVVPGLIDMHTHLREPGFEYKETIASGSAAAATGGFTSVACMPNTSPVNDNRAITEFIRRQASDCGLTNVYPIAAITEGSKGEQLADLRDLKDAGAVAFSDDGLPVMDAALMRRALEQAASLNVPIIEHCEDRNLSMGGVMHEGAVSREIGVPGIPGIAEEVMVARNILLAEFTGAPLHIAHVSTAGSVRLIREAKARGIRVTAETAPHYFTLTDEAVRTLDPATRVNPPLRSEKDRAAIREGLRDGTLDVIASDHAPHAPQDKEVDFSRAASGITGLETSLSLSLRLVSEGILSLSQLIEKMTILPARILRIPKGTLADGADADITVINPERKWSVDRGSFRSRGKNTPFQGWTLKGKAVLTIVGGGIRYRDF